MSFNPTTFSHKQIFQQCPIFIALALLQLKYEVTSELLKQIFSMHNMDTFLYNNMCLYNDNWNKTKFVANI